jgi:protocatechuate 3,4-dioxygenase beta subunit
MSREKGQGRHLTRRETLGLAGVTGAGLLFAGAGGRVADLIDGGSDEAIAKAAKTCLKLTPEQEEGPYYVDLGKVRSNIVEGVEGVPLALKLRAINPTTCEPLKNAAIDIWQCDALGVYSEEAQEGTSGEGFLRGIQFTDSEGYAELQTVWPGHYAGRATHIHVKVHIGGTRTKTSYSGGHVAHTGQMFLPEAMNNKVYERSPYSSSTTARVANTADRVYTEQGGARSVLKTSGKIGSALGASVVLGVNPNSTPSAAGTSGGGSGTTGGGGPGGAP